MTKKKDKWTNNDTQYIKKKTNYRATRTPLKHVGELKCSGREVVPAPLVEPNSCQQVTMKMYILQVNQCPCLIGVSLYQRVN